MSANFGYELDLTKFSDEEKDITKEQVNFSRIKRFKLKGLDKGKSYRLLESGEIFGGDDLMYAGINIPKLIEDFESVTWRFEVIE